MQLRSTQELLDNLCRHGKYGETEMGEIVCLDCGTPGVWKSTAKTMDAKLTLLGVVQTRAIERAKTRVAIQTANENNGSADDRIDAIDQRCWRAMDLRSI